MEFLKTLRSLSKAPLNALLKCTPLRRKLIFEIAQQYYPDLQLLLPLGYSLGCPLYTPESSWSYLEIFTQAEYAPALERMALPSRWLDLGCHHGFFSLYIAWQRAQKGLDTEIHALLVDADIRVADAVKRLIDGNSLTGKLSFAHGGICSQPGSHHFSQRSHMSSALSTDGQGIPVPTLPAESILNLMPPPYDLVKVDVEGAEYDLLTAYQPVLVNTRYLLLEWHSWHRGGGGQQQIQELAEKASFRLLQEVSPAHDILLAGQRVQCGTSLYQRAVDQ